jgi:hypothetical protein
MRSSACLIKKDVLSLSTVATDPPVPRKHISVIFFIKPFIDEFTLLINMFASPRNIPIGGISKTVMAGITLRY